MKKILNVLTAITLTVSGASSVISCNTSDSNKQKVNKIKNEIQNHHIIISWWNSPDTSNPNTIDAMKTALQKADRNIGSDINNITFEKTTLIKGKEVPVKTIIKVGSDETKITLYVTLDKKNKEKVEDILKKITKIDINVSSKDPDTSNPDTINAIKTSLQTANPTLTEDDLANITFSTKTLISGKAVPVTAIVTVQEAIDTKLLKITWLKA